MGAGEQWEQLGFLGHGGSHKCSAVLWMSLVFVHQWGKEGERAEQYQCLPDSAAHQQPAEQRDRNVRQHDTTGQNLP